MPQRFIGDRLRYARLLATKSLDEVGELVSASRQFLHQLETGAKEPSAEMRHALADALGVTSAFFGQTSRAVVAEADCHFRRYLTAPRIVLSQAVARGTFVEELSDALEHRVRLPPVDFPHPIARPTTMKDVEDCAVAAREHWGLKSDAPIANMTRVLERAGALVVSFGDISDRIDALSIARGRPLVVRSTAKDGSEGGGRPRFDLAHECGHLVMHQGIVTGDQDTEDQANRFASAFLLPARAFAREFPRGTYMRWPELYAMKKRWKVSVRAIIRRAFDLALIDAAQYRSGNIHLSRTGQSKREDFDDAIPFEPSETLPAALSLLAKRKPIELQLLIDELGMKASTFSQLTDFPVPELPSNVHVLQC